jgi:hypothetical protein
VTPIQDDQKPAEGTSHQLVVERPLIGIMPVIKDQITALRRHNA